MENLDPDALIDSDVACLLAGVKLATLKSWARKDRILMPVDALGKRGKNRYRTSDVLNAMKIRGIRPPQDVQLPLPRSASTVDGNDAGCGNCTGKDAQLRELQDHVEALEGKNAALKEAARLLLRAS
jgi:hypothetical protein